MLANAAAIPATPDFVMLCPSARRRFDTVAATIAGCIERGNCIAIGWIKKVAVLLAGYVAWLRRRSTRWRRVGIHDHTIAASLLRLAAHRQVRLAPGGPRVPFTRKSTDPNVYHPAIGLI
ncbi:hypothetical protein ACQR10_01170 [Bradyrhizobium sp. HKCCYLRH2060]|uniref:hypothetical protein n=1 Tax=Bradyrhizobium sp. HKCCYLRH2060 TaxID=3420743 RepID=UPI003EBF379A